MTDLFENISKGNKEKLLKTLEAITITFPKNVSIFYAIHNQNLIGIVDYGYIQIIKNDASGNQIIMEDLTENSIFGSITYPILNPEYDLITKEETQVTIIDYDWILNSDQIKYQSYHQFIKNLLKIISEKMNEKNARIEILTKKTIRDKLLEYFKIMSKKNGSKVIYLSSTFTELASYLAIDRSAMARELKYLKEDGFIAISNKRITLLY